MGSTYSWFNPRGGVEEPELDAERAGELLASTAHRQAARIEPGHDQRFGEIGHAVPARDPAEELEVFRGRVRRGVIADGAQDARAEHDRGVDQRNRVVQRTHDRVVRRGKRAREAPPPAVIAPLDG